MLRIRQNSEFGIRNSEFIDDFIPNSAFYIHNSPMRLLRLRGRKTCDRVLRLGRVWKGKTMLVRWLPGVPRNEPKTRQGIYIGTLASTKLDKSAVKRNRMRRRCREGFRLALKAKTASSTSVQLLVSPRSSSLTGSFADIQIDVAKLLSQLPS